MTKIALLGLGRWGGNHLRVLHKLPIELFVSDVQPKQLEAARQLGIPATHCATDPRELIAKVDAAMVVTPAQTHFELVRAFLEADKDVFVEKPITLVSTEARQLTLLAEKRQRILQVGHIFRFDPATQWLKEAIQQGQFGTVGYMRASFSGFKRPRNDSGVLFADAIHFIDLFNYLLGHTPSRVLAVMRDILGRGLDDASVVSLEYQGPQGATWGMVEANYFVPGKFREVVITGSTMSAICDFNVAQYKIKTYQNRHERKGDQFQAVEGTAQQIECPPEEPLLTELRAFIASVQTRQAPRADGWAGYDSVRVLEAALESAKTGKTIELKD